MNTNIRAIVISEQGILIDQLSRVNAWSVPMDLLEVLHAYWTSVMRIRLTGRIDIRICIKVRLLTTLINRMTTNAIGMDVVKVFLNASTPMTLECVSTVIDKIDYDSYDDKKHVPVIDGIISRFVHDRVGVF